MRPLTTIQRGEGGNRRGFSRPASIQGSRRFVACVKRRKQCIRQRLTGDSIDWRDGRQRSRNRRGSLLQTSKRASQVSCRAICISNDMQHQRERPRLKQRGYLRIRGDRLMDWARLVFFEKCFVTDYIHIYYQRSLAKLVFKEFLTFVFFTTE